MWTSGSAIALASTLLAVAPPSGRPPIGALERHDPRVFDVSMEVLVYTYLEPRERVRTPILRVNYNFTDAEVAMPVILESTFSAVDGETVTGSLWLGNREDPTVRERLRFESGKQFNSHQLVIPIERLHGDRFRWRIRYRTQTWSSRINDEMAAEVDWPEQWPREVHDALAPQPYIESADPIFRETVERISEGRLREVPPYYAAKDIVRYVLRNVQIEEGGEFRGQVGVLMGMNVYGAKHAATSGRATPHDLVAVCVAMLRAADIPARPVVGVQRRGGRTGPHEFVSWAEFYLPGAGWVPFDPVAMRGKGLHRHVREPWPEFGTMRDLNMRVPLGFHFAPSDRTHPPQYPAVWGWHPRSPRPGPPPESRQEIQLSISYQGRGEDEERP